MFTSGAALVWKAEFGLNGLTPQDHKALHEWEMFKGRIDGGDAAEDQKKKPYTNYICPSGAMWRRQPDYRMYHLATNNSIK